MFIDGCDMYGGVLLACRSFFYLRAIVCMSFMGEMTRKYRTNCCFLPLNIDFCRLFYTFFKKK